MTHCMSIQNAKRVIACLLLLGFLRIATFSCEGSSWQEVPEKACGLLGFSVCCHIMGVQIDTETLLKENPVKEYGSSLLDLKKLCNKYKLYSTYVRASPEDFIALVRPDQPAIFKSTLSDHFLVTTGYCEDSGTITIIDVSRLLHTDVNYNKFKKLFAGEAIILSQSPLKLGIRKQNELILGAVLMASAALVGAVIIRRKLN